MAQTKPLSVTAYAGDAKTLLAFNFSDKKSAKDLAGFTIQVQPDGQPPYYIQNTLQFEKPDDHAQDAKEPPNSSINAPIHKFRWLHVPGSVHQGVKPFFGKYRYIITPRYFKDGSMQPLDAKLSAAADVNVGPFHKGAVEVGFTRGFTQSQAFTHHFGLKALIRPAGKTLLFDTSAVSGSNAQGQKFTFEEEYEWLGFTARQKIISIINEVLNDASLHLDVFAYDFNEPVFAGAFLALAKQGRIRMILDDADLHHDKSKPTPEDDFEVLFSKAAKKPAEIKRGHFSRYSHDKILIVSKKGGGAMKVLAGSTNFSVTGLYVNSNHVLVFSDTKVADEYAKLFDTVWNGGVAEKAFLQSPMSSATFSTPNMQITFAPHSKQDAAKFLNQIADRIKLEGTKPNVTGSVLFAVMEIDNGTSPVYDILNKVHENQQIFSYGISDNPKGIALHALGKKTGVLVTGKPASTVLPPPFDQVKNIGFGHQVHHKFVVCGFNTDDAVVYCGSSNLALGGERENGDNLLEIHDKDIATVFAIEALGLVDHFDFLDRLSAGPKAGKKKAPPPASKKQAAVAVGWFLTTDDKWTGKYFDPDNLYFVDRMLFGK
jgi:phosphatidylserine/phosphatidylglycerophosphate/cardiolipin synthase-like enzyme